MSRRSRRSRIRVAVVGFVVALGAVAAAAGPAAAQTLGHNWG